MSLAHQAERSVALVSKHWEANDDEPNCVQKGRWNVMVFSVVRMVMRGISSKCTGERPPPLIRGRPEEFFRGKPMKLAFAPAD